MAKQLGHLTEFDPAVDKIGNYLERVDLFFQVNETKDDKRVPFLLNAIGGKTYALLRDLTDPDLPSTKTLDGLKTLLRQHFEPKPIIVAERFYFHKRSQGPTESIADYVAELRRLAKTCQFGTFLEEALRDQLVCGVRSLTIEIAVRGRPEAG